jgi:hypothetical protein
VAEWVGIRQAATILGRSEDTVRRWIKAGSLQARQEPLSRGGYRWLVQLDATASSPAEASIAPRGRGSSRNPGADVQRLEELVALLREERERLWGELESRRREVDSLHVLLRRGQSFSAPLRTRTRSRKVKPEPSYRAAVSPTVSQHPGLSP